MVLAARRVLWRLCASRWQRHYEAQEESDAQDSSADDKKIESALKKAGAQQLPSRS